MANNTTAMNTIHLCSCKFLWGELNFVVCLKEAIKRLRYLLVAKVINKLLQTCGAEIIIALC
jgi:hypothetical protein